VTVPPFVVLAVDGNVWAETYTFTCPGQEPPTRWNVSYAKQLVGCGCIVATVDIDRQTMMDISTRNEWNPAKLPYVDPSDPGIAAPFVHEGALIYILIDGTHRCVKALQQGVPFRAHLLTDDAARACHIEGPKERMPWSE
jgi:hypothetical protein